ncbi:MAG TPA: hypothetical protein VFN10_01405 [Thermoanaerobaculia bacterium]|nr:hypothetical protein [Thermoanaerobaculia bacterium]
MQNGDWIPLVGIICSFGATVWIVALVTRSRARRAEVHAQVQAKLIDRFSSAPELIEFLRSPTGREFVTGVQSAPVAMARERIMRGLTSAIILTMLGIAFVTMTFVVSRHFAVPAAILFCLGVGYLISTFVSMRLAAKYELDDAKRS